MNITRCADHAMDASRRRLKIDDILGFDDFSLGARERHFLDKPCSQGQSLTWQLCRDVVHYVQAGVCAEFV